MVTKITILPPLARTVLEYPRTAVDTVFANVAPTATASISWIFQSSSR
jgi:hypothetical protein